MATLEEVERALHNAHAAGDTEAATHLAGVYKQMRDSAPVISTKQKEAGLSPETQQSIRMTTNGVAALPEFLIDMPLAGMQWGSNKINHALGKPENTSDIAPVKHSKEKFLEMIGVNPKPANGVEEIVQGGLNAASSAGMAGVTPALGKLGKWLSSVPAQQVVGAIGGGIAGHMARESEASPGVQLGAQILGGVTGAGAAGIVGGLGKGIGRAGYAALSPQGHEEIAGRALYRQTTHPDQVIERLKDSALRAENVPGSKPITAEIASDPGLAMAAKGIAAHPLGTIEGMDQIHQARQAELADTIGKYLDKANRVGGEEDIMNKLDRIKTLAYNKFSTGKDLPTVPVNATPVVSAIDQQLVKFAGNDKIESILQAARRNAIANPDGTTNFTRMWNSRKAMDSHLFETTSNPLADATVKGEMKAALMPVRNAMNFTLKDADPEFGDYLRRFSHAEQYKGSLVAGRTMADRLKNSATTAAQNVNDVTGANVISGANAQKIGGKLTDLAGNDSTFADRLTPRQQKTFANIAAEMKRAGNMNLGNQAGSGTSANIARGNLLSNDIIDSIVGSTEKPGTGRMLFAGLGKTIEKTGITAPIEAKILRSVGQGLIDPDEGLRLLELGKKSVRGTMNLRQAAANTTRAGTLGALLAR